jgi:hypothetical protein
MSEDLSHTEHDGLEIAELIDQKATWFKDEIVSRVVDSRPDFFSKVFVESEYAANESETLRARQYHIVSPIGSMLVFPDFTNSSAVGAVVNLGLVHCMLQEGYTLDHIVENAPIYGKMLPATLENSELFAYYLTHRINGDNSNE